MPKKSSSKTKAKTKPKAKSNGKAKSKSTVETKVQQVEAPEVKPAAPAPEVKVEGAKPNYGERFVNGLIMIFIGGLLFLNTFGLVPWNIWWTLLRFWPIFLILGGLKLIFGRSKLAGVLLGLLTLFIMGCIFSMALLASGIEYIDGLNVPTKFKDFAKDVVNYSAAEINEEFSIELAEYDDSAEIQYDFDLGAGEFTITDDSNEVIEIDAKYFESFGKPELDIDQDDELLAVKVEQYSKPFIAIPGDAPEYDIKLTEELEIAFLGLNIGAGRGDVVLQDVDIKEFVSDVGAGELNIKFRNDSVPERIDLDVGAGSLVLDLPRDVGIKLSYSVGVGELTVDGEDFSGFGRDDDEYKSDNYDEADTIIEITVNVGVGSVEIK
jgi:hypothetical protein